MGKFFIKIGNKLVAFNEYLKGKTMELFTI